MSIASILGGLMCRARQMTRPKQAAKGAKPPLPCGHVQSLEDRVLLSDVQQFRHFVCGSKVFYASTTYHDSGTSSTSLWVSDSGKAAIKLKTFPESFWHNQAVASHGVLYFAADDGVHGPELWKSDGTRKGTMLVKDLVPGAAGAWPDQLAAVDGKLLFIANDSTGRRAIWSTDGTAAGTREVANGVLGPAANY